MLVDTHCHLFFDELKKDLDGVLSRAAAAALDKTPSRSFLSSSKNK